MTRARPALCVLAMLAFAALWPASAAAQRAMTIIDLLNLPSLSDPQLSPDGQQMLYVQSEADWKNNRRVTHIWRVNRDGSGRASILTRTNLQGLLALGVVQDDLGGLETPGCRLHTSQGDATGVRIPEAVRDFGDLRAAGLR